MEAASVNDVTEFPDASGVDSGLFIGVDSYHDCDKWCSVEGTRDAARIHDVVLQCFTKKAQLVKSPLRNEFMRSLRSWVTTTLEDDTTGIFFYGGHGYESEGDLNFVPADSMGCEDDISLMSVMRMIDRHRIGCSIIFFVAACRTNSPSSGLTTRSLVSAMSEIEAKQKRYDVAFERRNDFLLSFACEPQQTVACEAGQGTVYAKVLSELLREDRSINEVLVMLADQVKFETKNQETPWFHSCLTSDLWLHRTPTSTSSVTGSSSAIRETSRDMITRLEYSHVSGRPGLGISCVGSNVGYSRADDLRKHWRTRIDRIAIESNISSPSIALITDTQGRSGKTYISHYHKTGMGAHYLIERSGHITELVHPSLCAWCGNPGFWGSLLHSGNINGEGRVNEVHNHCISIALEGDGDQYEFLGAQYQQLLPLLKQLMAGSGIKPWNVVGLSEVCTPPGRFPSPGKHFEWSHLALEGLVLDVQNINQSALDQTCSADEFKAWMMQWGYDLGCTKDHFESRLASFRSRYRIAAPSSTDALKLTVADFAVLVGLLKRRRHLQRRKLMRSTAPLAILLALILFSNRRYMHR